MDAFPEAKVIINKRSDVETWYRSLMAVIHVIESWSWWARSLVDAEEFWIMRCIKVGWVGYFEGDYRRKGREVYERHYRLLEERAERSGSGRFLVWQAEDGW